MPDSDGNAQFTVRFRTSPGDEWQWANQRRQVGDGELVWSARKSRFDHEPPLELPSWSRARDDFGQYFSGLSSAIEVQPRMSEAPGSVLWDLSGNIYAANEGNSATVKFALGIPTSVTRYFSLVRVWSPWLAPRHGRSKFQLTEPAMLCAFLRRDGEHLVLLAVSGVNAVRTLFESGEDGRVVVDVKSDNPESTKFTVLASVSADVEIALSAVMYEARKRVQLTFENEAASDAPVSPASGEESSPTGDDAVLVDKDPGIQWISEWYDGLSYCTWNSLGRDLSERKIVQALDSLKSHGVNIVNLIIDDNWQALDGEGESQFRQGWKQFEANPEGFPHGLKKATETIRRSHPSIHYIAVWHALLGYWGGISPVGDIVTQYKTKQVAIKDRVAGGNILAVDPEDVGRFYADFYSYLSSVGINAVKTDAQFFLDLLDDPEDRRRFTTAYQDAWSIASLRHFSFRSISCMSLVPQIMFHSQLPTNRASFLLRNSDDFFPEVPTSHPWHIFCNAHNALLTRFLNVIPDWDMFQTSHPYASFHAASRCVSGGPICITDEPGKHDLDIINQIAAPTISGTSVTLRPSVVGRTLDVYHDYNEGHILRIGSYTGWARTGSGIMGLFNLQSSETSRIVPLMDFPGIHSDSCGQYIVRAHTTGNIAEGMQPLDEHSLVAVRLAPRSWEILTAYPTRAFTLKGSHGCNAKDGGLTRVAILGLLGKMTGGAALVSSDITLAENGRLRFDINLKALGTLGVYFSDLPDRTIAGNFMVCISGQRVPRKTVWKEGGHEGKVLAVDVHSAWKAMGLDNGWSNEILVQVFAS